jgi:hypothetical protein
VEQRDKSPVANTTLFHCQSHISGCAKPFESLGNGRVKAADRRKACRQKGLENIEPPPRSTGLNKTFSRLDSGPTPEILERSMLAGQLAGRHAEQQFGRTRAQLRANRTDRLGNLAHIKRSAGSADDRVSHAIPDRIIKVIE